MFFVLLLLLLSGGFLFMAYMATLVLADAGLGWLQWVFVAFAFLMGLVTLAWAMAGVRDQIKLARGGDRVEAIFERQRSEPSYTLNAAIRDLLQLNKKGEAIRLYRERRGGDQTEATRYVDAIEKERK